jgi:hypothetical protein
MEHLNAKFDSILQQKATQIEELALSKSKNKKMIQTCDELGYGVKTTIYKINAEQEKKLKASKAYKKKEDSLS